MVKAYTRTGDKGETYISSRKRVRKDSFLIEACGAIDELNAVVGLARVFVNDRDIKNILKRVQKDLFVLTSDIVILNTESSKSGRAPLGADGEIIQSLETQIDKFSAGLRPVHGFIIPGEAVSSAVLNFARAVTRRTERRVVTLSRNGHVDDQTLAYINRLSSLLFILSRIVNLREGAKDILWHHK